jgi:hypothetical protein
MRDASDTRYFWCLNHHRVENSGTACAWGDRLGPYDTETQAHQALQLVEERNRRFDAEDELWEQGH